MRNVTPKFSDQELFHLAEKFGTPYFLIDETALRKNVSELEQAYQKFKGPFRMAYSIKANYNPSVIKTFVSEGIMFDLTASNELYFLLKCGGSAGERDLHEHHRDVGGVRADPEVRRAQDRRLELQRAPEPDRGEDGGRR